MKVPRRSTSSGYPSFSFLIGHVLMSFANHSDVYWAFHFPACILVVVGGPDLSFASSSIIISNAVLPEEQGVAGSFISTVVQYSLAIGLGIAATVETHVNKGGQDLILGYRGAWWLRIGFAAVCVLDCGYLRPRPPVLTQQRRRTRATAAVKNRAVFATSESQKSFRKI
ncbi:MAG: hypothetical protein Q9210_007025 [Variospora velana]